jgi:hypothetical protein
MGRYHVRLTRLKQQANGKITMLTAQTFVLKQMKLKPE